MNINYKLWPNTDGNLGNIKVQIPTGIGDDKWPEGDALIGNFVYKDGMLAGFVDTKALTVNDSKSTVINYDCVDIHLDSIKEGDITFNRGERSKYFTVTYGSGSSSESFDFVIIDFNTTDQETINTVRTAQRVVDNKLYAADDSLIGTIDTSKIEVGGICDEEAIKLDGLFCDFDMITFEERGIILSEFDSDLPSLINGDGMFVACINLTSFSANLSSLTSGSSMFEGCSALASFSSDLPSLINGDTMFYGTYLTSFNINLSSLTNGARMFSHCPLTTFSSKLSSLTDGNWMFSECKLDALSVKNIIDTINTYSGTLHIGMGCNDTTADKDLFAQEVGYADMTSLLAALKAKGWTVWAQYNGRPTTTYSLRRPSENTLPIFAKLEEEEKYADYTSLNGSKKYMLNWFHETTSSTEGYTQFDSLEEAIEYFNIKPIE